MQRSAALDHDLAAAIVRHFDGDDPLDLTTYDLKARIRARVPISLDPAEAVATVARLDVETAADAVSLLPAETVQALYERDRRVRVRRACAGTGKLRYDQIRDVLGDVKLTDKESILRQVTAQLTDRQMVELAADGKLGFQRDRVLEPRVYASDDLEGVWKPLVIEGRMSSWAARVALAAVAVTRFCVEPFGLSALARSYRQHVPDAELLVRTVAERLLGAGLDQWRDAFSVWPQLAAVLTRELADGNAPPAVHGIVAEQFTIGSDGTYVAREGREELVELLAEQLASASSSPVTLPLLPLAVYAHANGKLPGDRFARRLTSEAAETLVDDARYEDLALRSGKLDPGVSRWLVTSLPLTRCIAAVEVLSASDLAVLLGRLSWDRAGDSTMIAHTLRALGLEGPAGETPVEPLQVTGQQQVAFEWMRQHPSGARRATRALAQYRWEPWMQAHELGELYDRWPAEVASEALLRGLPVPEELQVDAVRDARTTLLAQRLDTLDDDTLQWLLEHRSEALYEAILEALPHPQSMVYDPSAPLPRWLTVVGPHLPPAKVTPCPLEVKAWFARYAAESIPRDDVHAWQLLVTLASDWDGTFSELTDTVTSLSTEL